MFTFLIFLYFFFLSFLFFSPFLFFLSCYLSVFFFILSLLVSFSLFPLFCFHFFFPFFPCISFFLSMYFFSYLGTQIPNVLHTYHIKLIWCHCINIIQNCNTDRSIDNSRDWLTCRYNWWQYHLSPRPPKKVNSLKIFYQVILMENLIQYYETH